MQLFENALLHHLQEHRKGRKRFKNKGLPLLDMLQLGWKYVMGDEMLQVRHHVLTQIVDGRSANFDHAVWQILLGAFVVVLLAYFMMLSQESKRGGCSPPTRP